MRGEGLLSHWCVWCDRMIGSSIGIIIDGLPYHRKCYDEKVEHDKATKLKEKKPWEK